MLALHNVLDAGCWRCRGGSDATPHRRIGRACGAFTSSLLVSRFRAGLGVAMLAWAVHDLPIPSREEVIAPRVIVLGAADGQQLARKGPVRLPPMPPRTCRRTSSMP